MPDFEAIEVLTQAKERIFEHGWRSCAANVDDPSEDTYCLEDGLTGERGEFVAWCEPDSVRRAADFIRIVVNLEPCYDVWEWNDTQDSAGVVFDALDAAILLAKDAPTPTA